MRYLKPIIVATALVCWAANDHAEAQELRSEFSECMRRFPDQEGCFALHGRMSWLPENDGYPDGQQSCAINADILWDFDTIGMLLPWKLLFFNERCWRLRFPYFGGVKEGAVGAGGGSPAAPKIGSRADTSAARPLGLDDVVVYKNAKFPFSWTYPASWKVTASSHAKTRLAIVSENGSGNADCSVTGTSVPSMTGMLSHEYVNFMISNKDIWIAKHISAIPSAFSY